MGFIYSFVSLNPEQLAERRQLLDFYGQIAQLSALVPIVVIYLSHIFPNIWKRFSASVGWRSTKAHQSPRVSTFQRSALPGPWALRWRRFTWALNEEIVRGWDGWGTKGLWVTAVLWALWLLILVVKDTGNGEYESFDLGLGSSIVCNACILRCFSLLVRNRSFCKLKRYCVDIQSSALLE